MDKTNKQVDETALKTPEAAAKPPTKKPYMVQKDRTIYHAGTQYKEGDTVELTPAQAEVHGDAVK